MSIDRRSVAGKTLDVSDETQLLVVGAGPAGLAAAIEGAERGLSVLLVDEHPVSLETMAESVPLQFGGRASDIVRNRNAMMEAMLAASPDLERAFDAGVDVRMGTACVGLHVNAANLNWLPGPVGMLVEEGTSSSLVRFDAAVVASGRRDMGLAFPGWDMPGVLGATAAVGLATRYRALAGRRAVILGSTAEAMLDALALADAGIEVAGLIEAGSAPAGPAALVDRLAEAGIAISCETVVAGVEGSALNGVERVRLSDGRELACDLVILAVGAVPVVDLLDAAGAVLGFSDARGGYVPVADDDGRTTIGALYVAGDGAGLWPGKSADPAVAQAEGRRAAAAVARVLGRDDPSRPTDEPATPDGTLDIGRYRKRWVHASVIGTGCDSPICQCEEVTAREILEVRPPRYLGWQPREGRNVPMSELLGDGPPHPDQIKRLTRAGMGPCQGRRCREQVQALLALLSNRPLADVRLASYRAPVRPIPLSAAAVTPELEDPAIRAEWDSWFGMPRQWVAFWDVDDAYTTAGLARPTDHVSE